MIGLRQRATVYGEDATTKKYTVVLKSDLPCLLLPVSGAQSMQERAEMNSMRRFFWDASYPLPNYAQIDIGGQKWHPMFESITEYKGTVGDKVVVYICDVVKVKP